MSTHLPTDPQLPDIDASVRPVFSQLTSSLAPDMQNSSKEKDRWYLHAERVVISLFCATEGEHGDSWAERVTNCEWKDDSSDSSIAIIMSKMRVIIEAHSKDTPVVHRIRCLVWLGILTQSFEEAEVLKYIACQEYLLYRCRDGTEDFGIGFWLRTLCRRNLQREPPPDTHFDLDLLARMRRQLARMGEMYDDSNEPFIAQPDLPARDKKMIRVLVGSLLTTPQSADQPNQTSRKPLIERETLVHLQELEERADALRRALGFIGTRIRRRIEDLAAYRKMVNDYIRASLQVDAPTHKGEDLDAIMKYLKFLQGCAANDMEIWRQVDTQRQSAIITIGRLQKLLGIKKKANKNKNKNKNRNRAARKRQQQGEGEGGGEEDEEAEDE